MRGDPSVEALLGLRIDDRPDMGRDLARIADRKLRRRAGNHLDQPFRHVVLHAQEPQGRAALPGGAEGRGDDVVGHLFRQGGGVHDHGVDAAGLRDQRRDRTVPGRERAVDRKSDLRRAGERDAGDARIGNQGRAGLAVAGHKMQRGLRHAGVVQKSDHDARDQRRLLGGLGDHGIAGNERGGDLP